jgi:predicted nucleic acid-binding protein
VKVFLDANILFSASKEKSRIGKLIAVILDHGICVTNAYAIEEAKRNLKRKHYGSVEALDELLSRVTIDNHLQTTVPVPLKNKDIPILGGAIALGCSHLLTGDERDFGRYFGQTIAGVQVISPKQMAEKLIQGGYLLP